MFFKGLGKQTFLDTKKGFTPIVKPFSLNKEGGSRLIW